MNDDQLRLWLPDPSMMTTWNADGLMGFQQSWSLVDLKQFNALPLFDPAKVFNTEPTTEPSRGPYL